MKRICPNDKTFSEKTAIKAFSFCCSYIDTVGYDALREVLEVRLNNSDKVRTYSNVPEDIWYQFRGSADPDIYYRRCICGHFPETVYHTYQ